MKISICIPVYNAENTISDLVKNIFEVFVGVDVEIILVNDNSKDASESICLELCDTYKSVTFISLRKNVGEHNAVICALNYADGDYAIIMDDDFQNEPKEAIKLLDHIQKGYDVVYSKYYEKKHSFFRNLGSKFNDIVATFILGKPKGLYLSSFKIINRAIVKEIIKYKGPFTYIDGLILRHTDNIGSTEVHHSKRKDGHSNYTLKKLVSLWLNMFINFSIKPLRFFTFFGFAISAISFLFAIYIIVLKMIQPDIVIGWSSIMIAILFFSGIQMIFLGLLGEYIGKHYLQSNGTPQYTVKMKYVEKDSN